MKTTIISLLVLLTLAFETNAQTGTASEPVRYIGGVTIDPSVHEGRLRYAIGTESRQTLRVNRTHPELAEDYGWTYNHASNLAYWKGKFYQQYLSNPIDEHIPPGHTLLTTSPDGRNWEKPTVIFPHYKPPKGVKIPKGSTGYMMHQRMGFYISPDDRMLTVAFYGHSEDPFMEGGIGRVVRELYEDGTMGPIYFVRYSSHMDWDENNTSFPFYKTSKDKSFIAACDALLSDKLKTLQWWDEDRGLDGFYSIKEAREAISYYKRKDGNLVALWKRSMTAISEDGGITFSSPTKSPTLIMAGGKNWGQQTEDGRFAMTYNPIELDEYRYPLITITSDDGIIFDNMVLVQGEVPPRRFYGRWKDFGPCYVRGIVDGNGNPPGDDMWLTYSMNKEDIWISRVPTPIQYAVLGDVNDDFENMEAGKGIANWNTYNPKWAPVDLIDENGNNNCVQLKDKDPFDYARAIRVFEESNHVEIIVNVNVRAISAEPFEIDVVDRYGNRPVRIAFDASGNITALDGSTLKVLSSYENKKWIKIGIQIDATPFGQYSVSVDDKKLATNFQLAESVKSVERISFRTGPYRDIPNRKTPNEDVVPPLPGADDAVGEAIYLIDNFSAQKMNH